MRDLLPIAEQIGERLKARGETIAVAESSSGGLISAALLGVPGASAFYLGGGVIYTARAARLLEITKDDMAGMRSSSEPYAQFLAGRVREKFRSDWGISETGAAGPTGNPYGDAPGHTCCAVSGPVEKSLTLETQSADRADNMHKFARAALELLLREIS
ncbi:MAG TPA: CinA family protein [Rhizomicrobium sp.]|jgi:PncC family amidohydrolase|nr:CinA family protein [Rhizomicrobium sp.]